MYPDVFRMLVEHLPKITPDDAKNYSRQISALFAEFKAKFDAECYFAVYMNSTVMRFTRSCLRDIIHELSCKY
jgi:hypothetical protein